MRRAKYVVAWTHAIVPFLASIPKTTATRARNFSGQSNTHMTRGSPPISQTCSELTSPKR
jgi:hypothetical protein